MNERVLRLVDELFDNEGALISGRANIFYYSGFTSEDAMLFLTKDRCVILTDSRYTVQAKQQAAGFEVFIGRPADFLKEAGVRYIWYEDEEMTVSELSRLKAAAADSFFIPRQFDISKPRRVKDAEEIKRIAAAEALGDAAFSHILNFIRPGIKERDIALELEFFMRKNGASALSFETICASGVRSAMPHGTASEKIIESGELLTLDFGCVLDGYCSDMTRTVAVGNPGDRQREIYETVKSAQEAALCEIAPGKVCRDIDKAARDIIAGRGYGDCFGHGLGHSVGIEIHESPSLSPRSQDILEPGNVVTVEPGIYIEGFAGVRIEDLIVLTENGYRNLTSSDKELVIL
ncbi:MAG: aminopeptidase P family protein [Clostridia bacterium]|nr:aminopeptidase P family protein [Clostridia bacterium]